MKRKTQIQKTGSILFLILICFASFTCKKDTLDVNDPANTNDTYSSTQDFFNKNGVQSEFFTFNEDTGGSFNSVKGSQIIIPPNTFVDAGGNPVSGNVTLEFKDIYDKSDMVLSDMSTEDYNNNILVSGGMFYIRIKQNAQALDLAVGKKIVVRMPLDSTDLDTSMAPYVSGQDSSSNNLWWPSYNDSLLYTATDYIYNIYNYNNPDSGSWYNCDSPGPFSSYPQTLLTINQTDDPNQYNTQVFLLFPGVNAMMSIYMNYYSPYSFMYSFAPVGLNCTIIAIGVKDQKLYYAREDIIITQNLTTNFTLTETTTEDLISVLQSLNL